MGIQSGSGREESGLSQGVDRRQHPRYHCEGKAEIRTSDSPAVLWGLVTDLSANGCYIELASPLPAGKSAQMTLTVLETTLNVEGRVAVVHPMFGMGVAFTACPAPERQKLELLLSVLEGQTDTGLALTEGNLPPGQPAMPPASAVPPLPSAQPATSPIVTRTAPLAAAAAPAEASVSPARRAATFRLTPQVACAVLDEIVKQITQKGVLTRADLLAILHEIQAKQK